MIYCTASGTKDGSQVITGYEYLHHARNGWYKVKKSILDTGITDMQIYRNGDQLTMVIEVNSDFDPFENQNVIPAMLKFRIRVLILNSSSHYSGFESRKRIALNNRFS